MGLYTVCVYWCMNVTVTDVLTVYQDVDVTDVTMQWLSNQTCNARLTVHLGWIEQEQTNSGQQLDRNPPGRGSPRDRKPSVKQQRRLSRVEGLVLSCTHCRHNEQLQFRVSVDQSHDRKVGVVAVSTGYVILITSPQSNLRRAALQRPHCLQWDASTSPPKASLPFDDNNPI